MQSWWKRQKNLWSSPLSTHKLWYLGVFSTKIVIVVEGNEIPFVKPSVSFNNVLRCNAIPIEFKKNALLSEFCRPLLFNQIYSSKSLLSVKVVVGEKWWTKAHFQGVQVVFYGVLNFCVHTVILSAFQVKYQLKEFTERHKKDG